MQLCLFLCLIFVSPIVYAGEVLVGMTAQQTTLFISDKNSQATLAEMENMLYMSPILSLRNQRQHFEASSWGYFYEFNLGWYDVNRQVVQGNTSDLNTQLSGFYVDVTPTLTYVFTKETSDDWLVQAGVGVGIGYLSVKGSAYLTERAQQPRKTYNHSSLGFTAGVFLEVAKQGYFFQTKGYGPVIDVDSESLQLVNVKIVLGKSFTF